MKMRDSFALSSLSPLVSASPLRLFSLPLFFFSLSFPLSLAASPNSSVTITISIPEKRHQLNSFPDFPDSPFSCPPDSWSEGKHEPEKHMCSQSSYHFLCFSIDVSFHSLAHCLSFTALHCTHSLTNCSRRRLLRTFTLSPPRLSLSLHTLTGPGAWRPQSRPLLLTVNCNRCPNPSNSCSLTVHGRRPACRHVHAGQDQTRLHRSIQSRQSGSIGGSDGKCRTAAENKKKSSKKEWGRWREEEEKVEEIEETIFHAFASETHGEGGSGDGAGEQSTRKSGLT